MKYDFIFVAVPSFSFSARKVISQYFITEPVFLDNGFVQKGRLTSRDVEKFLKRVEKEQPLFAVLPDHMHDEWRDIVEEYYYVIWLAPIHSWDAESIVVRLLLIDFDNIVPALPCPRDRSDRETIDYPIRKIFEFSRVWILGLRERLFPLLLQYRQQILGFDTTIPLLYAQKYGKFWYAPNRSEKPKRFTRWTKILDNNCKMLRRWLLNKGFFPIKITR